MKFLHATYASMLNLFLLHKVIIFTFPLILICRNILLVAFGKKIFRYANKKIAHFPQILINQHKN